MHIQALLVVIKTIFRPDDNMRRSVLFPFLLVGLYEDNLLLRFYYPKKLSNTDLPQWSAFFLKFVNLSNPLDVEVSNLMLARPINQPLHDVLHVLIWLRRQNLSPFALAQPNDHN